MPEETTNQPVPQPQPTTVINKPSGPVDASTHAWMGPSWSKTLMGWGAVGFICAVWFWQMQVDRMDRREDAKTNRDEHREAFEKMRLDNKEGQDYDREQRKKTNTLIREQTKVLENMDRNQIKMYDAIIKKMP